jgi:hypothetical protein
VQRQLLAEFPSDQLRVYAVWLPMLWSDSRSMWSGWNMPDPRVIHFWDGQRAVGQWFAEQVEGYEGVEWDTYSLYGPEAVWDTLPAPQAGSGSTIYADYETLEKQVRTLLGS